MSVSRTKRMASWRVHTAVSESHRIFLLRRIYLLIAPHCSRRAVTGELTSYTAGLISGNVGFCAACVAAKAGGDSPTLMHATRGINTAFTATTKSA